MANYYDIEISELPAKPVSAEQFSDTVMYCKLFGDVVHDEVCGLRRRILATRNGFSCKGCIINISGDGNMC